MGLHQLCGPSEEPPTSILSQFKTLISTIGIRQWFRFLNKEYNARINVSVSFWTYQTNCRDQHISMPLYMHITIYKRQKHDTRLMQFIRTSESLNVPYPCFFPSHGIVTAAINIYSLDDSNLTETLNRKKGRHENGCNYGPCALLSK